MGDEFVDMDPLLERGIKFERGLQQLLIPYKVVLKTLRMNAKQLQICLSSVALLLLQLHPPLLVYKFYFLQLGHLSKLIHLTVHHLDHLVMLIHLPLGSSRHANSPQSVSIEDME